jgi:AsmA protein
MKKVLIALGVILVLLVGAVVALPFFIPVDTIKEEVVAAARDATGRELSIKGDVSFKPFPRFELEVGEVSFANAEGASDPNMAEIQKLLVQVQVLPLLSGQVRVDSFVLEKPVIHLEIDKNGKANYVFESGEAAEAAGGEMTVPDISLGDVRLVDGLVTYSDLRSGQRMEISAINMTVSLPDMASPFSAKGSLDWQGETIELTLNSDGLQELLAGQQTPLSVGVKSDPVTFDFEGQVTKAEAMSLGGTTKLDVPSLRNLAAWTGNPLDMPGEGFGPLKIDGKVAMEGNRFSFSDATITFDQTNGTGALSADLGSKKPQFSGKLDLDKVDTNLYMAAPAEGEEPATESSGGPPPDWSDDPIDASGLQAVNADFALSIGEVLVRDIKIGRTAVAMALVDGLLNLDLTELNLYGGSGNGKVTLNGRGKVPAIEQSFKISGVQAEPLLIDAAKFNRLSGTANLEYAITATGTSQRQMVQSLGGKGSMLVNDGAIKGINLAAMVRNVSTAFLDTGAGQEQKTDFAELSGTFNITSGILSNDDLKLLSPLLRITGKGTSDLPKRTVNYRVTPKAVASVEGQGAAGDEAGVAVPVIIEGPWHNLSYKPDLAGLVEDIAKDPTKALENIEGTVKQIEEGGTEGVGKILEGLTGGSGGSEEGGDGVQDKLKNLFQ